MISTWNTAGRYHALKQNRKNLTFVWPTIRDFTSIAVILNSAYTSHVTLSLWVGEQA